MKELFALSYGLLWCLVILEAVLLRDLLRRTVWFKRFQSDFSSKKAQKRTRLHTGTTAPHFTASLLGSGDSLSTQNLNGHPSILLFVSPEESSPLYENLRFAIHALWHKTKGNLYLVCNGTAEACRHLVSEHSVEGFTDNQVPVLLDEGGRIAQSFLISDTPQAVELDENLRVGRYGRPEPIEHDDEKPKEISSGTDTPPPPIIGSDSAAENVGDETERSEMAGKSCDWPDDLPTTGAAFARMDTTVSCVMTRFRLRSTYSLIPFYFAFRRVRRSARDVAGLLTAVFLIEDFHTCYTMSLWKDDCAIVDFGRVHAHTTAANSAFAPTWRNDLKRSEIWSAQFRLWAVSSHNLNWEGLDLQTALEDQWGRRAEVAAFFDEDEVSHDR